MFNVSVNDKKNIYRSKPVMNVDTVPKPLTYDYMPEGYPSKGIEYVTLMEEQEVTFTENKGLMGAISPVALDIKLGDKLRVVWDGVNYDAVVKERVISGPGGNMVENMFGNLALINRGDTEDYPFACCGVSDPIDEFDWITADTAATHTIKVMRQQAKYTPIDVNYMPEGYPSKGIEYVTLMEEQEVVFADYGGQIMANSPVVLNIKPGEKLTVVWDGVSYDVIVKNLENAHVFGNLAIFNSSMEATDYPFVYTTVNSLWLTTDTATSHTIKVMRRQETITPMSTDFIPKNLNVVFRGELGHAPTSCNATYNELRDWVERDIPVFAVFITANAKFNITSISLLTDSLGFIYYLNGSTSKTFVYKSDGTFAIQPNQP